MALGWLVYRRFPNLASAYISGITWEIDPFATVLALRFMQCHRHQMQIRHPLAWPAFVESLELLDQRNVAASTRSRRYLERTVGKYNLLFFPFVKVV